MKTVEIVVTESGKKLVNAEDGFVVYGNILKGDNVGGLIGSGKQADLLIKAGIVPTAYTNFELIKALDIDYDELVKIVNQLRPLTKRSDNHLNALLKAV